MTTIEAVFGEPYEVSLKRGVVVLKRGRRQLLYFAPRDALKVADALADAVEALDGRKR